MTITDGANINNLAGFDTNIQRLWQIARNNAERAVSHHVYHFVPATVQKALVDAEILAIMYIQADDMDSINYRTLLENLVAANNAVFGDN